MMKITSIIVYVIDTGSYHPVVVELQTDEGITGVGEAAVGFGNGAGACSKMILELSDAFVKGRDPFRITDIWNDIYYHTFWGKGGGLFTSAAASAIETALWDIKGKALGVPVYEFLGGRTRDMIPVYANDWSQNETPQDFARRAEDVVSDGFRMIKVYPLSLIDPVRHINRHIKDRHIDQYTMKRCIEIVKQVRQAVGDEVEIMVDVTAEATPDVAASIGEAIRPFGIKWFEEPVDPYDIQGYEYVRNRTGLTIAGGERLFTRYGFREFINRQCIDVVQPDPGTCGGIMEAFIIGKMAEAADIRVAPHNCGGPVLTAAALQVFVASANAVAQEIFPYRPKKHYSIVENAYELNIRDGKLDIPTLPGIGVELSHKTADPYICGKV